MIFLYEYAIIEIIMPQRKIPGTMATQHPDHAAKPYWHAEAFISNQHEAYECFLAFSELGITEYKWDWEGKLVDESVVERFFSEHFEFFSNHPLGVDRFLTYRLPNPKVETEFRLGRAFMNLSAAASVAKHLKLPTPPLFEVILPMTETAEEIFSIQEAFAEMHFLKHPLYKLEHILTSLRIIPLFEQVSIIINSDNILRKYFSLYKKRFKKLPPYFRPYVARSDPALNSGIIPTVLAIKIALSRYVKLEKELDMPMYPIIGAAALPFRGGITPYTVEQFSDEYAGVRTTTIQSAFRYDYPKEDVITAISKIEKIFPTTETRIIDANEEKIIIETIPLFEQAYRITIEKIAKTINDVSLMLPKRRERVQHIGLFGYSRGVGKVKLPRAITFTGSLYSIGIPPEIIGTGRSLRLAQKKGTLPIIIKYYKYLKENLLFAGGFINRNNLKALIKQSSDWQDIQEDITAIEDILNISLEPQTKEQQQHQMYSARILEKLSQNIPVNEEIIQAALLRKSVG